MAHYFHFALPAIYYLLAGLAVAAFVGLAVIPFHRDSEEGKFEIVFLLSAGAALFACRWPVFLWNDPLNVDEGYLIACAMKATVDWIPWRSFDAGTSGPLNCYVLTIPALFGADIGFFSARVVGLCLITGAITALYYAVKWIYGAGVARLSILPPVLLFSFTKTSDFLQYSSEHLPIFLTTAALAGAAYLARGTGSNARRWIACAAALLLGCALLAKAQALPIAMALLASVVAAIFLMPSRSSRTRRAEVLVLVTSIVAISCFVLIGLSAFGFFREATISYYKMARVYVRSGEPVGLSYFLSSAQEYTFFLVTSVAVMVAGGVALSSRAQFSRPSLWSLLSSLLLLLASLVAIYVARRPFPHYLLFSIIPLSFCVANVLGLLQQSSRHSSLVTPRSLLTFRWGRCLFAALFFIPLGLAALASGNDFSAKSRVPMRPEELAIARYAKPGDRIVVWAWRPELYVKTRTIMGTRDPSILLLMQPSPYREYFRERFLSDVLAHPPRVFVDGVAPNAFTYKDRATEGFETFPALAAFVHEHYAQREEVAGVRIFVAKE